MLRFYPLKIEALSQETANCISIAFKIPDNLKPVFQYKQGQYLTLKAQINGKEIRRNYSLCSSPLENEWRVAVKKVENGQFSTFANEVLRVGDVIEVMPPIGKFFTDLDPTQAKHYVAFAAGSGITPILSILKTVLQTEPNSTFTLFYGNQRVRSIIFKETIEGLKNRYLNRFVVHHFLTREQLDAPLFNGRFTKEKLNTIFAKLLNINTVDEFFICGPEASILDIKDLLLEKGIPKKQIHFELFTTANRKQKTKTIKNESLTDQQISQIVVIDGGKSFAFDLAQNTDTILDAALEHGADLPFACKGGVCSTCKAQLLEGEVSMELNYVLEPEELEAGYILSCQSRPISKKVTVDFDITI